MTAPFIVGSSQDGPTYTVNTFLKHPTLIRNIILDWTRGQFIGDALLRPGPRAIGGAIAWQDPFPLFAEQEGEIIAEYGEIPGIEFGSPIMRTKATTKRGMAVKVSQEMIDRQDVNLVLEQINMLKNSLRRMYDRQFMATIFNNSAIPTMPASTTWFGNTSTSIRRDLADASYSICNAYYGTDSDQKFGYEPDTLVINNMTASEWLDSDEVNKVFTASPLADQDLRYTGKMPKKFFSFNVLRSWQVPADTAVLMQRGRVGFNSDERPLKGTPLYEIKQEETWRADFTRINVTAIDNPKAAMIITGIES